MKNFIAQFIDDEQGSATVEFVVVLPIFMIVMWALMTIGDKSVVAIKAPIAARYIAWSQNVPNDNDVNTMFYDNYQNLEFSSQRNDVDLDWTAGELAGYINQAQYQGYANQAANALNGWGKRVTVQINIKYNPWMAQQAAGTEVYNPDVSASHTVTIFGGTDRTMLSQAGAGTFRTYMQNNLPNYQDMPRYDDTSRFWVDE